MSVSVSGYAHFRLCPTLAVSTRSARHARVKREQQPLVCAKFFLCDQPACFLEKLPKLKIFDLYPERKQGNLEPGDHDKFQRLVGKSYNDVHGQCHELSQGVA